MSEVQKASECCTLVDIGWLAGFVEGEGWMGMNGTTSEINIVQKDDWPLWQIQAFCGGTVSTFRQKKTGNDYYRWRSTGPRARGIIMTIYKFLSPRRQVQARIAIDKHGQSAGRPAGIPWSNKDYEARRRN